jgi:Tfp pilus assembly protein PilZ
VSVRYEHAPEQFIVGDVVEMSVEGLFVAASKPLSIGRLFAVEIRILGEPLSIDAIGRVVWARDTIADDGRPTGMGVKLLDMDEASRDVIARLVMVREQTMHGIGPVVLPILQAGTGVRAPEPSIPFPLVRPARGPERRVHFEPTPSIRTSDVSIPFILLPRRPAVLPARPVPPRSRGPKRIVAAAALLGFSALGLRDTAGDTLVQGETFAPLARADRADVAPGPITPQGAQGEPFAREALLPAATAVLAPELGSLIWQDARVLEAKAAGVWRHALGWVQRGGPGTKGAGRLLRPAPVVPEER